jgi:hypothetical protein
VSLLQAMKICKPEEEQQREKKVLRRSHAGTGALRPDDYPYSQLINLILSS